MPAKNELLRQQVLEACRGLAAHGMGAGVGGHVSVRIPNEPYYYSHVFDRTFEEMQLEDVILIDFDGKVIDSDRVPSIGIDFHHGIYKQRSDVHSVVHSHGFWTTAQAAFGRPPRIFNNVSTPFYERTAISPNDDFKAIGPVLGNEHVAIVIPWHGLITVGKSIGEAVALHVIYDYTARMDVTLPENAPTMPHEQCAELRKMMIERSDYVNEMWQVVRRRGKAAYNGSRVVPVQY